MSPFTPLLRPRDYFAAHEVHLARVALLVGLLTFAGPLSLYGVGWVVTGAIDGTVVVDNPARPPEVFCEDGGCDEPRRIDRDVDALLWESIGDLAGAALLTYPLTLLLATVLLHGGAWLAGADRGWFPTVSVAAWGLVPSLLGVAVAIVAMAVLVDPVTVAPGDDVGATLRPLAAQFEAFGSSRRVLTAATAVWGGVVWRAGLLERQGLGSAEATLVAGLVALLGAAIGLR